MGRSTYQQVDTLKTERVDGGSTGRQVDKSEIAGMCCKRKGRQVDNIEIVRISHFFKYLKNMK